MKGTCVKVRKQGEYRYSSSPLGKRIDIYETSETELDENDDQNTTSEKAKDACKSTSRAESSVKEEISVIEAEDDDQVKSSNSQVSQNLDFQQKVDSDEDSVIELLRNKDHTDIAGQHLVDEVKEEAKDETRLPSLCTFDVRDKKTTFMTACYVRKDIVTGQLITDQATIEREKQAVENKPSQIVPSGQSRNQGRQSNALPFGMKSTLL